MAEGEGEGLGDGAGFFAGCLNIHQALLFGFAGDGEALGLTVGVGSAVWA